MDWKAVFNYKDLQTYGIAAFVREDVAPKLRLRSRVNGARVIGSVGYTKGLG